MKPPSPVEAESLEQSFRFLDLPPELRNLIYECVINEPRLGTMSQVSHQLRSEMLSLLYEPGIVTVYMDQPDSLRAWMYKWEDGIGSYFRRIQLAGYQHFHYDAPRRHQHTCFSAINIDLKQIGNPVTY